jgi:predicted metal-dependent HD superfamily phosphohydrolase
MSIEEITSEFIACFKTELQATSTSIVNEIISRYNEPSRAYHNINHLFFILEQRNNLPLNTEEREFLFLVTLFHDFVYEIGSKENEKRSAKVAATFLRELDFDEARINWICNCILLTKDHQSSEADDLQKLFCDLDLLILASPSFAYDSYIQKIRKEYRVYPDFIYNNGRKKVLKDFLQRNKIFHSTAFEYLEDQARINIKNELKSL